MSRKSAADRTAVAKRGRPSSFTQDAADIICSALAEGHSLRAICLSPDAPDKATVFRWLREHDDFRDQYARAREAQADAMVDEMVSIADEATETEAGVKKANLRIEARKWHAGKLRPKVYGDPDKGPTVAVQINNDTRPESFRDRA